MNHQQRPHLGVSNEMTMSQIADVLLSLRNTLVEAAMMLRDAQFMHESDQNNEVNTYLKALV